MDLKTVKRDLPIEFTYRGKKFNMTFYSPEIYLKRTPPSGSEEIIWRDRDENMVYLFRDDIEYIKADD